jgi:hypothetical protein
MPYFIRKVLAKVLHELKKEKIVVVDMLISPSNDAYKYKPDRNGTVAHFARVLGIDYTNEVVYINDTNSN